MKHEIRYLTTDLQLRAVLNLEPLADALIQRGFIPHFIEPWRNGSSSARFAFATSFPEPDPAIAAMLTAIETLDESSQRLWSACTSRNFDIGNEGGNEPSAFIQQFSPETLSRIATLGAGLIFTIYPVLETEAIEAALAILKKDKGIKIRTGKSNGYGIHPTDSSSLKKNQAEVKVTLHGTKGSVFVHCLVELSMAGEWTLKETLRKEHRS